MKDFRFFDLNMVHVLKLEDNFRSIWFLLFLTFFTILLILLFLAYTIASSIKNKNLENEAQQASLNVDDSIKQLRSKAYNNDVLVLMIKNVSELREYYTINKLQAKRAFNAAIGFSSLGFLLFVAGIIVSMYMTENSKVIDYTTLSGVLIEIIAGLFFWLYNKAMTQINLFHTSLLNTEKFLTAIQLVEKISLPNRDKAYNYIIEKVIDSNSKGALNIESKTNQNE